jgi:DNA topoisomerase-1
VAKALVIVESPAKAKTIMKFLGPGHVVKASMGHVRDLPKNKIGVDEKKNFKPTYQVLAGRKKVIDELRKSAESAEVIYLAADPDREGEAICWHLAQELKSAGKKIYRVLFNEITKKAITQAMEKPGKIDDNKVDAQQARRILDRLVGYKISPLLWDKVRRGLSAGRVQSVALRMICDREKEREAFKPEEYWSLVAKLAAGEPPPFEARLTKRDGEKFEAKLKEEMDQVLHDLAGASFAVREVTAKEKKRNPVPPFITSRLQQDAARRLGFTVKKTMMLAQGLYEGKEIGESGAVGLISYMRTDSTRVSDEALAQVREFISKRYGNENLPDKPRVYASRKGAQDAHEAIRPTSIEFTPEIVQPFLTKDEFNLYLLIWNRFVASQMESAIFDTTSADITAGRYTFRAAGSVVKFAGFLNVYDDAPAPRKKDKDEDAEAADVTRESDEDEAGRILPPLEAGQALRRLGLKHEQHFTQPPPRYGEAMLVKALEENGIGRPSTYASILGTIQTREYVEKEKSRFIPTELGRLVTELLITSFGDIVDIGYTARLEEELDEIEDGKLDWVDALKEFNVKFTKDLKRATSEMRNVKTEETPTDSVCEKCGKPMVIKWGRYGKFLACSGYPECRNTQEMHPAAANGAPGPNGEAAPAPAPASIEETCPKCGKPMVLRKGRFGPFIACSGYPECKTTRRIQITESGKVESKQERILDETCPKCGQKLVVKHGRFGEFTACSNYPDCRYTKQKDVGVPCPKDGGHVVERRSKKGRTFYGCDNYPKCDFVLWNKPVARACPKCKAAYLLEKRTKRDGEFVYCGNEACDFKETIEPVTA